MISVVSAALVEIGSLMSNPGAAPDVMVEHDRWGKVYWRRAVAVLRLDQHGMVLLSLNTLVTSWLIG